MMKPTIAEIPPKLLLYQKAFIGTTLLLLGFSLIRETTVLISSPLLRNNDDLVYAYAFSIPITSIVTAGPLLVPLWLCWKTAQRMKYDAARPSIYQAARIELEGNAGIALFFFVLLFSTCLPIFIFVDDAYPFSVTPLTTPACGMLGAFIGQALFRRMKTGGRLTLLAAVICSILATEYFDWNPRKPLIRDLYRIRVGMTVGEVEQIMTGHLKGFGTPDNLARDFTEEDNPIVYRTGEGGAYNADMAEIRIKDGRVEAVDFLHD